jgi:hypothetical protein
MALANAKLGASTGSPAPSAEPPTYRTARPAPRARARRRGERPRPAVRPAGSPALSRYAEAARLLTGDPAATIEDGIVWIRQTVTQLQIPRLREFGLQPEDFGDITASAMKASSTQGNPVTLTDNELHAILAEAA